MKIYISSPAGTGKTAVANTIAEALYRKYKLPCHIFHDGKLTKKLEPGKEFIIVTTNKNIK